MKVNGLFAKYASRLKFARIRIQIKRKNQIIIKENNQILTKVQKPGSYQGKKPDPNGVKKLDLKQS